MLLKELRLALKGYRFDRLVTQVVVMVYQKFPFYLYLISKIFQIKSK